MPPDRFDPTTPIVVPAPRRGRRRLAAAVAAGSLLAVGAAGAVVGASGTTGPSGLRTAEVGRHEVVETLDLTGTVVPVAQAAVAFPTAGTVATVDVAVGDAVEVGDLLATLDRDDLDDAIVTAREAVALAELGLEQALAGETVTAGSDASPSGSATGRQPTALGTGSVADLVVGPIVEVSAGAATAVTDDEVAAAQQAVLAAARGADDALAAAEASLALAADVCAAVSAPVVAAEDVAAEDAAPSDAAVAADTASSDDARLSQGCRDALAQVLADQEAGAAALASLGEASDALDALLAARAAEPTTPAEEPPTTSESTPEAPTGSTPATGAAADAAVGSPATGDDAGAGGGETSAEGSETGDAPAAVADDGAAAEAASAEELVAYQSAVDAAAAQLAVAQQALDQATIVSPVAGTVAAVELAVGDEVTAASSTAHVLVVGSGGYEVSSTLTVDDLAEVEVGQPATVEVDGASAPLAGEVVAVGLSSTTGDAGRVYPVTIGLTATDALHNGTLAEVSVELAGATDAVAVPTSAVDLTGAQATVTVVDDEAADGTRVVPVTLGAVGGAYVEVDGVELGDVVVVADLSEPLPDSAGDTASSGQPSGGRPPMVMSGGPPG